MDSYKRDKVKKIKELEKILQERQVEIRRLSSHTHVDDGDVNPLNLEKHGNRAIIRSLRMIRMILDGVSDSVRRKTDPSFSDWISHLQTIYVFDVAQSVLEWKIEKSDFYKKYRGLLHPYESFGMSNWKVFARLIDLLFPTETGIFAQSPENIQNDIMRKSIDKIFEIDKKNYWDEYFKKDYWDEYYKKLYSNTISNLNNLI